MVLTKTDVAPGFGTLRHVQFAYNGFLICLPTFTDRSTTWVGLSTKILDAAVEAAYGVNFDGDE